MFFILPWLKESVLSVDKHVLAHNFSSTRTFSVHFEDWS